MPSGCKVTLDIVILSLTALSILAQQSTPPVPFGNNLLTKNNREVLV
jgi:hypothetical protein